MVFSFCCALVVPCLVGYSRWLFSFLGGGGSVLFVIVVFGELVSWFLKLERGWIFFFLSPSSVYLSKDKGVGSTW